MKGLTFGGDTRWLLAAVILLAVLIHVPTVWWGFFADDYGHQCILRNLGEHPSMRPWSLYDFGYTPERAGEVFERGSFPWWTSPDWKGRFLRPISSMTLWLDYTLYGDHAAAYHVSSLLWLVLLCVLLFALYRALLLTPRMALVGLLIFAASKSCMFPVGWMANRNSLVAVTFTAAAVLALASHQRLGRYPALICASILGILAALSKESGIACFVLIPAYMWMLGSNSQSKESRRWASAGTISSAVVIIGYLTAYFVMGYGVNSLFYPEPWDDPVLFVARTFTHLLAGGASLLGIFTAEFCTQYPQYAAAMVVGCAVVVLPVAWMVWRVTRAHPSARFLAVWFVITILPQVPAPPSDRLLFLPSVGSSGLLAIFLCSVLGPSADRMKRWLRTAAVALACTVIGFGIASKLVMEILLIGAATEIRAIITTAPVGDPGLGRREVFILQSPSILASLATPTTWVIETDDLNLRFWPMQMDRRPVKWTRVGARTFELESQDSPFLGSLIEIVFRSTAQMPQAGEVFETALFKVHIIEAQSDGVRRFRVECPDSLDAPQYRFLGVEHGRWVKLDPPAVGQSIVLPAAKPRLAYVW